MRRYLILCVVGILLSSITACEPSSGEPVSRAIEGTPTPDAAPTIIFTPTPTPAVTRDPSIIPSPTPCLPNPEWTDTYVVQSGDTLGAISIAAGTTIKAMQESNCLSDRDLLVVGQVLLVPNAVAVEINRSPQGLEGTLAFIRDGGLGKRDIWTARLDGSTLVPITESGYVIGGLVRSPNLTKVAYRTVSEFHRDGITEDTDMTMLPNNIGVARIDGTEALELVKQGPLDARLRSLPDWSPDSISLAFTEQDRESSSGALVTIQSDGQARFVVTVGDFTPPDSLIPITPDWSPDGMKIAYVAFNESGMASLRTIQTDGTQERTLVEGIRYAGGPYWVPRDGFAGAPAVGYAVIENSVARWYVVDPVSGEVLPRERGLALVQKNMGWLVYAYAQGWGVFVLEAAAPEYIVVRLPLESISWSGADAQFVYPVTGGLLWVDMESATETQITEGKDSAPVWTPPLWLVLP